MRYRFIVASALALASAPVVAQTSAGMATEAFAAAGDNDVAALAALVARGYDVNYVRNGNSALWTAVALRKPAAVRYLLDHGADPTIVTFQADVLAYEQPRPLIDHARRIASPDILALLTARLPRASAPAGPPVAAPAAVPATPTTPATAGRTSARWPAPGTFAAGTQVLISTNGGLDWRAGTVQRVGSGEFARQYLVVDGNGQTHWLDWTRVTTTVRQPYWTGYLTGDWSLHTGMYAVTRTDGRDLYRIVGGGMKLPPLRIAADGSYIWATTDGKLIRGRWTPRADVPGIVLKAGDRGLDWTAYNSGSRSSLDVSGKDELRLANPAAMGSVGSRIGT